jgi:hypothetical protein
MKNRQTHITRFLIVAAALICGYFTLTTGRTAGADSTKNSARPTPDLRGPAAIRHLEQTGLYNSLSAAVTAARYQIEACKEGGHEATNPKQGYRIVFMREGVEVRGSGRTGSAWRLGMKLTAYGYGKRKKAVTFADVKARGDRIEYERRASDGGAISEWYVNRASGLEQGFTIAQAPGKRRAGEKLNLWLKLSGDLKARLGESGQAILLNGRGTGAGLRYDKLHAFDTTGREIEARMKLNGDQVRIEVSDEGAIYPMTIDPTLTQQQKLLASDAGAVDVFGASVAISGETVVVSAPVNDDGAILFQGAAYVFVRSGGIWSQQQKLLASDAGSNDQFGFWVAISGETVVVGAAFDDDAAGADQGAAYVFERSGGVWSQHQKLLASDAGAVDVFGSSVAISGETVVVGAPLHGDGVSLAFQQGSAYVFAPSNQPPDCSGAFPSVSTIWPPNHDMINVTIQGVTDPDGDPVTINIDQIEQDEPTDGTGDSHTCPDGAGIGTSTAQVRAERSAQGNGRVYTIYFTASDGNGGSCQGSVTVCVPRSVKGSCTNGGAIYDSTACVTSLNSQFGRNIHGLSSGEPAYGKNYCLLDGILHILLDDPLCVL